LPVELELEGMIFKNRKGELTLYEKFAKH